MRHGKKVNHLGRKTAHRKAMLANMACSLIEHKRINTTVAKAKALKQFVEPLITKSKAENNLTAEKGTHNRRIVFKNLRDKYAVTELFSAVSERWPIDLEDTHVSLNWATDWAIMPIWQ